MNNNPFKKTRLLFWTLLLIAAVTTILFETDILTRGAIEVSATTRYLSDVTGVLITICLIPIAIKKFSNAKDAAKKSDEETFAQVYCHASKIRLMLFFVVTMTNIGLYYGTANNSAIYCALAGAALFLYSFPRKRTMQLMREE